MKPKEKALEYFDTHKERYESFTGGQKEWVIKAIDIAIKSERERILNLPQMKKGKLDNNLWYRELIKQIEERKNE